jgi:predicted kinase/diadenosine tetraphosphatase ApaH/serine/threonine PP2A family protein phosphatase
MSAAEAVYEAPAESIDIRYPPAALVLLVGPSGAGKSTFAARHFAPTQVLSSDACRAMVADDPGAQAATEDAFALLHTWLDLRLKRRRFTVVDSTALKPSARDGLLNAAAKHRVPAYALVLDVPLEECVRRDAQRTDRSVGEQVIRRQYATFEQARREVGRDARLAGTRVLMPEEIERVRIAEEAASSADGGARFDAIGDVHGCWAELADLLEMLGYAWDAKDGLPRHPDGRVPAFVGDLADRGPDSPRVLRLACDLVAAGLAVFVPGNHDDKLFRMLKGSNVTRSHGLDLTEQQIDALPRADRDALTADILARLATAPPYRVLDDDRLVIAHAGIREDLIGQKGGHVRTFTLYGDVRGFEPGTNKPIRHDWAREYKSRRFIAYGHTPAAHLDWRTDDATGRRYVAVPFVNNTANLDTGCVFGGALTALRWPERELYSVPARAVYAYHEGCDYSRPVDGGGGGE